MTRSSLSGIAPGISAHAMDLGQNGRDWKVSFEGELNNSHAIRVKQKWNSEQVSVKLVEQPEPIFSDPEEPLSSI